MPEQRADPMICTSFGSRQPGYSQASYMAGVIPQRICIVPLWTVISKALT